MKTLGRLLADQRASRGGDPFLFFEDESRTYDDVHGDAHRVGGALLAAGLEAGDRVALLLPNTPDFITAWFGAATAGLVIVPINPAFKRDEVAFILGDSSARAVITTSERTTDVDAVCGSLPELTVRITTGAPVPGWRSWGSLGDSDSLPIDEDAVSIEDPAAIIYTSGTTGHPKGVVLTHANYAFDTWSLTTHLETSDRDRFLCFLPLFHVNAQVVSVLSALHSGGALVLLAEFKPATFLEQVARYRATTFSAVPTVYAILNTLPDKEKYDLTSLRYCVCGAAPMPVEVFNTFEKTFGATIVEGYGLSEATCGNCVNPVGESETRKIGSIGVPLPGQEMRIVDDAGEPVPDGTVGEIVIRGSAVMKEYFRNPEASREALKRGWLHTGDLGHRDEDGYFFIVGRKKEMIIRGGENIYPKEIEEVLYQDAGVQEAAVIGVPDDIWGSVPWRAS